MPALMNIWHSKDIFHELQHRLSDKDVAHLRASSVDCKGCVDSVLQRLSPVHLDSRLLNPGSLPGLKVLHVVQLHQLQPVQLLRLSCLTQLTQLHIAGQACGQLRSHQLSWVGKLTNLRELSLSKCTKVRVSVLACWHSLRRLERLTLIGLTFTAADAHHIVDFLTAGACSSLTSLVLGDRQGLNFLSDRALEGLGRLLGPAGKLRVLDLSGCIELTDAGVRQLAGITSLHSLQLPNALKIGSGAVQELSRFTALRHLNLRGCSQLQDLQLLQLLHGLTNLETLNLQSCSGLTGSFLTDVCRRLFNLQTLNLAYCPGLYPCQLACLSALPALSQLDLTGGSAVSGLEVLLLLGRLQQLRQLHGGHWRCKGSAASLAAITNNSSSSNTHSAEQEQQQQQHHPLLPRHLEHLSLSHLSCSESFLQALLLSLPSSLTSLDLSSCSVPGFGRESGCLSGLQGCQQLRRLNLSGSSGRLAEVALRHLSGLSCLTELQLDHINSSSSSSSDGAAGIRNSDMIEHAAQCSCSTCSSDQHIMSGGEGMASQSCSRGSGNNRGVGGVTALLGGTGLSPVETLADNNSNSSSSSGCTWMPVRRNLFSEADQAGSATLADFLQCSSTTAGSQQQQQQELEQLPPHQLPRLADMQQLQHLTISFSTWVDDHVLTGFSGLSSLRSLSIISCHRFSGSGFGGWGSITDLTRLNLSGCGGVSDAGLAALAGMCGGLQELLLAGCKALTDAGVAALGQLRRLRRLNLTSNRSITHRSMAALFPELRHLTSLCLDLCTGICDEALACLAAAPGLAAADVRGCWQITDEGVRALLLSSPSLQQLNVDSCHRLSAGCCPDSFDMTGHGIFSSHSSNNLNRSGSSSRPSKLIRVAMHAEESRAAAGVAAAAADDARAVQAKVAAVAGGHFQYGDDCGEDFIGTAIATAAEELQLRGLSRVESLPAGLNQGQGQSGSSGSSAGCLELSALQRALDQP